MGLFSRKKKPTAAGLQAEQAAQAAQAAVATQAAAAAVAAQQQAQAQRVAAEDAARQAAASDQRRTEEKILADITTKRKHITQLERAVSRFEDERKQAVGAAIRARNAKKDSEMKAQLRNVKRLEARSKQYQTQIVMAQQQLDALEDVASQRRILQDNKDFGKLLGEVSVDADEVQDAFQDMREAIQNVNDVGLTVQADSQLNGSMYDMDDADAELNALAAEYEDDVTTTIPNVPGEVPNVPVVKPQMPSSSTVTQSEEEEIRRLEADIAF